MRLFNYIKRFKRGAKVDIIDDYLNQLNKQMDINQFTQNIDEQQKLQMVEEFLAQQKDQNQPQEQKSNIEINYSLESLDKMQHFLYESFVKNHFSFLDKDIQRTKKRYIQEFSEQRWTYSELQRFNQTWILIWKQIESLWLEFYHPLVRYVRKELKPDVPKSLKHDLMYAESQDRLRWEIETTPQLAGNEVTEYHSQFFGVLSGKESSLLFYLQMNQLNLKILQIIPVENDFKKSFFEIIQENQHDFLNEPDYYLTVSFHEYFRLFNSNPQLLFKLQKISELVHEQKYDEFNENLKEFLMK